MNAFTTGQAAQQLSVTPRTLRHWDEVGLLVPSWRSSADYRMYTDEDLERGLEIKIYRAAGFALSEIRELLVDHSPDRLVHQRQVLMERAQEITKQIAALDEIIGKELTMKDKASKFPYFEEAQEKYGHTAQWQESQSADQSTFEQAQQATMDFAQKLADAKQAGVAPGSPEAEELVSQHRASISGFYEVTPARQLILARMYTQDERFNETYLGNAEYLLTLIESSVNIDNPTWD